VNHVSSTSGADLPILFVDDEPDVLRALQRTLSQASWSVVTALGPDEGLRQLANRDFAVVVSDFRMPGMDGVMFLSQVRARWPDAERILLTAFADEGALERGINEAGISRFLRKPWKREVLVSIIDQALQHSRLRRENAVLLDRVRNRNEELSYLNRLLQSQVEESDRAIVSFRRRWDVALNAISDPVAIVGNDYRIEASNLAASAQANLALDELEGRKCHTVLFGQPRPCSGCPMPTGAGRVTVGAGARRVFDARAYPLPGSDGSHLCIYRDITRDVAFASEAAQMEKMAAIGRLAGGVAHEINNPLHGILSFVQLAQKSGVPADKLTRYHEVIYECAIRCRDIVQGLRDFSREAKGGERRLTELAEVCGKALVLFENHREVTVESVDESAGARCIGNVNQLQQVVVNLVQNAVDASPEDGVIKVTLGADDLEVWLSVEDQGTGVPAEIREKIFEPFFTTKPEGVGTGLGLAISHNIVHEHGGVLRVGESTLGGARFELRLPIAKAVAA
jgi:two-component system, NtrC family, sensor kinase